MLESGMALTAACLPTIYALSKRKFYSSRYEIADARRHNSMSSDVRIVAGFNAPSSLEIYALRQLDSTLEKGNPPDGKIMVNKSFRATDNSV